MSTEWTEETIREHMFTEVEVSDIGNLWSKHRLDGFWTKTSYPFLANGTSWQYMRLIPKPKKRLMTIKELWGKTLVKKSGALVAVNRVDSAGMIKMINAWNTVEEAHLYDWRLAGPDLDYETATSLEVEE